MNFGGIKFNIECHNQKNIGLTQATPETEFLPQYLFLKTRIYPKNPVSLRNIESD